MNLIKDYGFNRRQEEFGLISLTGEACGLGISILYDLTEDAINLLFEQTGLIPTKSNMNSRQGQKASCLLPYSLTWQLLVNYYFQKAENALFLKGRNQNGWSVEDRLLTDQDLKEIFNRVDLETFIHLYEVVLEKEENNLVSDEDIDFEEFQQELESNQVSGLLSWDINYDLPFPMIKFTYYNDHGKALIYQMFGGLVAPTGEFWLPLEMVTLLRYYSACMRNDFVILTTDGDILPTNHGSTFVANLQLLREEGKVWKQHNSVSYNYPYYKENGDLSYLVEVKGYPLRNTHFMSGRNHGEGSDRIFNFKNTKTGMDYVNQIQLSY